MPCRPVAEAGLARDRLIRLAASGSRVAAHDLHGAAVDTLGATHDLDAVREQTG
jgi:hypothetical protein